MSVRNFRPILLAAAMALAGCGGGSSGGVASIPPPPPPPPTSASAIIPAATTSQQFAVMGTTRGDAFPNGPTEDPGSQIKVRYDAPSQSYEVRLPDSQDWQQIYYRETTSFGASYIGTSVLVGASNGGYQYSRLLDWNDGANSGQNAVGMATQAGGVPVSGTATYAGQISGQSSEGTPDGSYAAVDGSINLSFNFGAGSLSGSITPNLHRGYELGAVNFRDTVYSTGSTTFSGKFDANAAGENGFNGLFTGPNAQELIGSFQLPYQSPIDGHAYRIDGAFVGAK